MCTTSSRPTLTLKRKTQTAPANLALISPLISLLMSPLISQTPKSQVLIRTARLAIAKISSLTFLRIRRPKINQTSVTLTISARKLRHPWRVPKKQLKSLGSQSKNPPLKPVPKPMTNQIQAMKRVTALLRKTTRSHKPPALLRKTTRSHQPMKIPPLQIPVLLLRIPMPRVSSESFRTPENRCRMTWLLRL